MYLAIDVLVPHIVTAKYVTMDISISPTIASVHAQMALLLSCIHRVVVARAIVLRVMEVRLIVCLVKMI
jgi:hypothetical protein